MSIYKIHVSTDEKNFFWIIVKNGKMINKNPTREELCKITKTISYNETNICHICREENIITDKSILYPGNALREKDKYGNKTEERVCNNHWNRDYQRYDHNSRNNVIKLVADTRTGNLRPDSESAKGDKYVELACKLYGWENLNKKNDNYSTGTPIDCLDKIGLYYQVRGRSLKILVTYVSTKREYIYHEGWKLSHFENEWLKKYESMICFCFSKDGKIIERIYIFPSWIIIEKNDISIYKNNVAGWYEKYRVKDEKEINRANDTWHNMLGEDIG